MSDIYKGLGPYRKLDKAKVDQRDIRPIFFEFFDKFKEYLAEYTRESLHELEISEVKIGAEPQVVFDEVHGTRITVKNQGGASCYLTTDGQGRFHLEPGEKELFWVNRSVVATTLSGSTVLGFIKC